MPDPFPTHDEVLECVIQLLEDPDRVVLNSMHLFETAEGEPRYGDVTDPAVTRACLVGMPRMALRELGHNPYAHAPGGDVGCEVRYTMNRVLDGNSLTEFLRDHDGPTAARLLRRHLAQEADRA